MDKLCPTQQIKDYYIKLGRSDFNEFQAPVSDGNLTPIEKNYYMEGFNQARDKAIKNELGHGKRS